MKPLSFLAFCGLLLVVSCTPLRRGFEGSTLISPAQPAVTVTTSLPLLASGSVDPFLYTDRGYQIPQTLVAVYGTDTTSPLAISVLAFVPNQLWIWDPLSYSKPDSPVISTVAIGGQAFSGSVHIIRGERDPFSPLLAPQEAWPTLNWLAQRYAVRLFFNQAKLILEYREPLPAFLTDATEVPLWNPEVQAFQERAAHVFQVSFNEGTVKEIGRPPFLKGLGKYFGNYLGSMSVREPLLFSE